MRSLRAMLRKVPRVSCHPIWTKLFLGCREWLQTCRQYAREGGTKENLPLVAEFPSNEVLAIIADNLSKAGWSYGYVSALDSERRTIWIADAHHDDGRRFVVRADEILTAFRQT